MSSRGATRRSFLRLLRLTLPVGLLVAAAGCAANPAVTPRGGPVRGVSAAHADARAEAVRSDPVAFLRHVAERCAALSQYTCILTRQERRGLGPFRSLKKPETIACWFRGKPYSIRMRWLDAESSFGETAYVAGTRDGRVRFTPRHGFLGFPPGIQLVEMQTPVNWGVTRYPLDDFGLDRLMQRTLESIERAAGDVSIEYLGLTTLDGCAGSLHHLKLCYPPSQYDAPIQELFIDVGSDLPVCTLIRRSDGQLDGAYVYRELNADVRLSDADFLLEAERPLGPAPEPARAAAAGN